MLDLGALLFLGGLAHFIGDYVLQSDWMAVNKTSRWWPAIAHAGTYGLPFLLLTQDPWALSIIVGTHLVIDRYRLARHVIWVKNFVGPRGSNPPWKSCSATGFAPNRPQWLTVWLMIITDNTIHITINSLALTWSHTA